MGRKNFEKGSAPSREKAQDCRDAATKIEIPIYKGKPLSARPASQTLTLDLATYQKLYNHQQRHKPQRAVLAQRVKIYLSHRLAEWGPEDVLEILRHTRGNHDAADPAKDPT